LPPRDLNELIAWLKVNSNKVSVGINSVGTRLLFTIFQKEIGTQLTSYPIAVWLHAGGAWRIAKSGNRQVVAH
jgi:hypothetical protein